MGFPRSSRLWRMHRVCTIPVGWLHCDQTRVTVVVMANQHRRYQMTCRYMLCRKLRVTENKTLITHVCALHNFMILYNKKIMFLCSHLRLFYNFAWRFCDSLSLKPTGEIGPSRLFALFYI